MAEYADSAGLSVQLLRRLCVPRRQGSKWLQSENPLLLCDAAAVFWKEHSERNWFNSLLAAIEVSKELRDYVGRRHVSSSDEYARTAQQVVVSLQESLLTTSVVQIVGIFVLLAWRNLKLNGVLAGSLLA